MSTEYATTPPALYRSEAFVEDLELTPAPAAVKSGARGHRLAAWLFAVPSAVAAVASAAMLVGTPV